MTDRLDSFDVLDPSFKPLVTEMLQLIKYHNLPIEIFETRRTLLRQAKLLKEGKTKTLKSKHLEGKAVDFVVKDEDGNWTWDKTHYLKFLGGLVNEFMNDKIQWGGQWLDFKDYVHFEMKD